MEGLFLALVCRWGPAKGHTLYHGSSLAHIPKERFLQNGSSRLSDCAGSVPFSLCVPKKWPSMGRFVGYVGKESWGHGL